MELTPESREPTDLRLALLREARINLETPPKRSVFKLIGYNPETDLDCLYKLGSYGVLYDYRSLIRFSGKFFYSLKIEAAEIFRLERQKQYKKVSIVCPEHIKHLSNIESQIRDTLTAMSGDNECIKLYKLLIHLLDVAEDEREARLANERLIRSNEAYMGYITATCLRNFHRNSLSAVIAERNLQEEQSSTLKRKPDVVVSQSQQPMNEGEEDNSKRARVDDSLDMFYGS